MKNELGYIHFKKPPASSGAPAAVFASECVLQVRLETCAACPHLQRSIWRCTKCGCFMQVKARLQGSACPIGSW